MTREEAQSVIMTEQKCVDRVSTDRCNRDCANCDLIMDDAVINEAYNMAIKALEQPKIIRCIDCKYFERPSICFNERGLVVTEIDGFCKYAKRREEGDLK